MSDSDKGSGRISKPSTDGQKSEPITFATFLASVPPNVARKVSDIFEDDWQLARPEIEHYCSAKTCRGFRVFQCHELNEYHMDRNSNVFLAYVCRNCGGSFRTFAVRVIYGPRHGRSGTALKFGEIPRFGSPVPQRLSKMFHHNRELFLKGWHAEQQDLGIGSFVYYRRVVELQKDQILEEFGKAAVRLDASIELLSSIERAKKEISFTKAIDAIKAGIPDGLMVRGKNPLRLLHKALSIGVHELSDQQCLEQAHAVRLVLNELVENMARITKDERKLNEAIKKLQQ